MARLVHERADAIALIAEVFRELGYEGASLSLITERTGLGKGSLYHFFPGGKQEMAEAVIAHIDAWFEHEIYEPLRADDPSAAIAKMWLATDTYFQSGQRVCLIGAFALDNTRDHFAQAVSEYFRKWVEALEVALVRGGVLRSQTRGLAEDAVYGIQGALVLSRALDDLQVFRDALKRMALRLGSAMTKRRTR